MSRGTTLANALSMLKTEIGASQVSGTATAADTELYGLIENQQKWLASEYDWPFLKQRSEIAITAGTQNANRFYTAPTDINFERPVQVEVFWTRYWYPVGFGIDEREYNALTVGDGGLAPIQYNPTQKWDWKAGDSSQIEIWPFPLVAQTLRFTGQRPLTSLRSGANFNSAATLDLDDLLVVLYAAAQKLSRMRKEDAKLCLARAEQRLVRIRASYNHRDYTVVLGGDYSPKQSRRIVPITVVA